jgi:hypothetical protein
MLISLDDDHNFALQSCSNYKYVCCEPRGLRSNRSKILEWEMFKFICFENSRVNIISKRNDRYVSVTDDKDQLKAIAEVAGEWEQFEILYV